MNDEFCVGVASTDISPKRPELLWVGGLHSTEPSRGVLEENPLTVDAMALRAGGKTAVVATCDTGGYSWRSETAVRKVVAARTGVDEKLVLVTGRHNHSAGARPADAENPDAAAAGKGFWEGIRDGIVEACVGAVASLRPAEIAAATATVGEPVGQNRRMQFGHGGVVPSWGSGPVSVPGEKFVGPTGPDSMRIDFLCAREPGADRPFALLTSYASHIHLSSIPYFSGEAAGGIKNALRERLGDVTVVYANPTGGDLDMHATHPVPPGGPEAELAWFRESCRVLGNRFADAVVPAIPAEGYVRPGELRHEYFETEGHETDRTKRFYLINAIRLGDIALASLPAELFVELVYEIYQASPIPHLLLMGFNGSGHLGYIGTPIAFEEGGYETGKGPAPSPEEEERMIREGVKSRMIGRARLDTGREIVRTAGELLARLAT